MPIENGCIRFTHYTRDENSLQAVDRVLPLSSITGFGVFVRKSYRVDNSFKNFIKCGYIISDGIRYETGPIGFKDCKENLVVDKSLTKKTDVEVYKYYKNRGYGGVMRAVEWDYKVKVMESK